MIVNCAIIVGTRGAPILVDQADFKWLNAFSWTVSQMGDDTGKFYAKTTVDGRLQTMHRLILGLGFGDHFYGDHINACTLDNRRENLRVVTPRQNTLNAKVKSCSKTGVKGVSLAKSTGKYCARIRLASGIRKNLGYFATIEEATFVYNAAAEIKLNQIHPRDALK